MAGSSLLALLDDIAGMLDDVAALTKVATKKTAGVLGDDLALNAEQVTGVHVTREIPVVLAVAKGSALNKAILVPAALAISAVAPWLVTPLLMLGGAFLCYEGFEKVAHKFFHHSGDEEAEAQVRRRSLVDTATDLVAFERERIRGAIRTDFILSAEIVVITLGTVADVPLATRIAVLTAIAAGMTVGVYGLVAAIVKLDDLGVHLAARPGLARRAGRLILAAAPWLMKGLSFAGTAAMFLVGGGILVHGIGPLHHAVESLAAGGLVETLANGLVGVIAGGLLVGAARIVR